MLEGGREGVAFCAALLLNQALPGLPSYYHHSVDELWCLHCEQRGGGFSLSQASRGSVRHSVEQEGVASPWRERSMCVFLLRLLLLHQPSVMWHDFTLREVERHLQGDQDGELKRNEFPPADPEPFLQLLQRPNRHQRMRDRQNDFFLFRLWQAIFSILIFCSFFNAVWLNFVLSMLKIHFFMMAQR